MGRLLNAARAWSVTLQVTVKAVITPIRDEQTESLRR